MGFDEAPRRQVFQDTSSADQQPRRLHARVRRPTWRCHGKRRRAQSQHLHPNGPLDNISAKITSNGRCLI